MRIIRAFRRFTLDGLRVSVYSPLPFPRSAAMLAAISAGEMPMLLGGSER